MKKTVYYTKGTCSRAIEVSGEDGRIADVTFYGGCHSGRIHHGRLPRQSAGHQPIGKRHEIRGCNCATEWNKLQRKAHVVPRPTVPRH